MSSKIAGVLHSTMDSSAECALLRLYVPHGAPCDGRGQEILKQHATGSYSASCATAHVGVPCSATRSVVTEHGQIGICWEQSEQSPIPAVLAQLQTDARFHAVQVYFCSPCWHRANVIVPAQPGCTAPRQSSDDTTSILTIVPSQLRSLQSCCPRWTHHPICMYIIAGFCFSGPSTSLPTHEWFSMTLQTIRRRISGCKALSSTNCDVTRASLLWQAFGTGALSYAAAWWLVAWLPWQSPLGTDQIEIMFQQGHDWLSWLCKEPGGFKVHPQWASTLAQPGHVAITAARVLVLAAATHSRTLLTSIRWIACVGGCQVALCAMADLVFALAVPFVCVHKVSAIMQRWQLAAVALTWDMVRNRVNTRTQLRGLFQARVTATRKSLLRLLGRAVPLTPCPSPRSASDGADQQLMEEGPDKDVIVEQMLVGMLFLAPMAATLPTTWLLHCVAAVIHASVAMIRTCAYVAACFLDSGCAYRLMCWFGQPLLGGAILGAEPDVKLLGTFDVSIVADIACSDDQFECRAGTSSSQNTSVHVHTSGHCMKRRVSEQADVCVSDQPPKTYSCPVTYYRVDAGYVPLLDALRPGLDAMTRELSFMQHWFACLRWNWTVT